MDKYESYDITDEQWKVIEPLMPPEYTGKKGRPRKDNRTMVNGILWINRSGAQWSSGDNSLKSMVLGKVYMHALPSGEITVSGKRFSLN